MCGLRGLSILKFKRIKLDLFNGNKGIWILNAQSTAIMLTLIIMFIMMFVSPNKKVINK